MSKYIYENFKILMALAAKFGTLYNKNPEAELYNLISVVVKAIR